MNVIYDMGAEPPDTTILQQKRRVKIWLRLKQDKYLYLLGLPGFIALIVFKFFPMYGILISFQDYSPFLGFMKSEWVGLEHFERLFSDPDFPVLLRNTLAINLMGLIFFFPIPIILALMLNEVKREVFKRTIQSIVYLPHFLSWVIIASLTFTFFATGKASLIKCWFSLAFLRWIG